MMARFLLYCPRCHKRSEIEQETPDPAPRVNCGDCLMNHVEIVQMRAVWVADDVEDEDIEDQDDIGEVDDDYAKNSYELWVEAGKP